MEKTLRMSLLFDFYSPLLTERQQDIFQMYFHEDLSLGEISEQLDVSRQAVYDMLKRAGAILEEFEAKLGLVVKHQERQAIYTEALYLVEQIRLENANVADLLQQLEDKIQSARTTS